jgi:hypothetical protein
MRRLQERARSEAEKGLEKSTNIFVTPSKEGIVIDTFFPRSCEINVGRNQLQNVAN